MTRTIEKYGMVSEEIISEVNLKAPARAQPNKGS